MASLVVSRGLGRSGAAAAAWEIFSDKIGGQIPAVEDLLLTGDLRGTAAIEAATSRSDQVWTDLCASDLRKALHYLSTLVKVGVVVPSY